jgi:hypothetical protein
VDETQMEEQKTEEDELPLVDHLVEDLKEVVT